MHLSTKTTYDAEHQTDIKVAGNHDGNSCKGPSSRIIFYAPSKNGMQQQFSVKYTT